MYEIGCLCFNNDERQRRMSERFKSLNIPHKIFTSLDYTTHQHHALECASNDHEKRCYSCILNHLSIIRYYYELGVHDVIIVCEDDVYVHKDLALHLPSIIQHFLSNNLDVLLLGCLLPWKHELPGWYSYNDELWGTQCYMLSRSYAKTLLDTYVYNTYDPKTTTFAADWRITKDTKRRAYHYPLLFVEEGNSGDNNDAHHTFHSYCTQLHMSEKYI